MSQPPNRNNPPSSRSVENKDNRLTLTQMIPDILDGIAANGAMIAQEQQRGTEFVPCFADTANQEEDDAAFHALLASLNAIDRQEAAESASKDQKDKKQWGTNYQTKLWILQWAEKGKKKEERMKVQ